MGICLCKEEKDITSSKIRKNCKYSILSANDNLNTHLLVSQTDPSDDSCELEFFSSREPILYNERCIKEQFGTYLNRHVQAHKKLQNKMVQFNFKSHSINEQSPIRKLQKKLQSNIIRENAYFKEFKYAIRVSAPLRTYKDIIKKGFDFNNWDHLEFKYNIIKDTLFEFTNPNQIMVCPQFSNEAQYSQLEENMSILYLNYEGQLALKRILWILKENDLNIQYNPLIKYTIQFLLCYFSEAEVYFMVKSLLDDSYSILTSDMIRDDIAKKLKFHFTLDMASFENFCILFGNRVTGACKRMKLISDHLVQNLGTTIQQVFSDLVTKAFYPSIPLIAHFQMMVSYLREGLRVFHNVGFSILEHHYKQILETKSLEELNLILASTPVDLITSTRKLREFFKVGFNNKLKKTAVQKLRPQQIKAQQGRFVLYYRPKLREHSYILQYKNFEQIWSWLPDHQKLQNPVQIFSTQIDGYSLQQIYLKAKEFKNLPMLLIVKTLNNIFGAYCDRMLNIKENKVYYGSNDCFVFQIEPHPKPYYSTELNQNHLFVDNTYFSIGSDSNALIINSDLQGKTFQCETYNNPPLNDADPEDFRACSFDILELEVYTLHFV